MKILIVDDKEDNRYLLTSMLKGNGYETVEAVDGEDALEKLRGEDFDMIISDILMPGMDGFQLCRTVKRDKKLRGISFIFYTATYTEEKDRELALKMGADRFIVKPCEPGELMKMLQEVIKNHKEGKIRPASMPKEVEDEVFKLYNERLVRKLEKKMLDLEEEMAERKRAEEKIIILSQAVERIGEMVIITDLTSTITYANPAVEAVLGFKPEEMIGRKAPEFFEGIPGNPPDLKRQISEKVRSEVWRRELFNRKKDGSLILIHLTLTPLKDADGQVQGYVGVAIDITERNQLEEELRHAQRLEAVGTLAGGLAHDFNNILTGIRGCTSMLKIDMGSDPSLLGRLDQINQLVTRGGELTKSLLSFARRHKYNPESIKINEIIQEVITLLERTAGAGIAIDAQLSSDISPVFADGGQLHQVFMNLCLNACEAISGSGKLFLKTANSELNDQIRQAHPDLPAGPYVSVIISDTGPGMDTVTRGRIFEPFYTTKTEKSGTGLGLSVVSGILAKHRGCITVDSKPGEGSTFTVYLPSFRTEARA